MDSLQRRRWLIGCASAALALCALLAFVWVGENRRDAALQHCAELRRGAAGLAAQWRRLVAEPTAERPSAAELRRAADSLRAIGGSAECSSADAASLAARIEALPAAGADDTAAARERLLGLSGAVEAVAHAAQAAHEQRAGQSVAAARRDLTIVVAAVLLMLAAAGLSIARLLARPGSARSAPLAHSASLAHSAPPAPAGVRPDERAQRAAAAAARADQEAASRERVAHYVQALEDRVRRLGESQQRLAEAQQLAQLGNWSFNRQGGEPWWSEELYRVLGLDRARKPSWRSFLRAVPRPQRRQAKREWRRLLAAPQQISVEHRIAHPLRGERVVVHRAISQADPAGRVVRLFGSVQDVTERKQVEDDARRLALFDPLTELPNRRFFKDHVHKAIERAKRVGAAIAVMFIDLDHFKRINDTLGHGVGDELLRQAAERLVHCVRGGDVVGRDMDIGRRDNVVARLGGDEFTVLLVDMRSPADMSRVARRVIARIAEPFAIGSHELYVTASIGMSVHPDDGDDAEKLLRHADAAMYEAKRRGKNTFQFFTADLHAAAFEKLEIERELRRAVEREQLLLHYQPKVDVRSGAIIGVEALLRWNHPEWGMVPPARFIPVAEELGMIVPIGDWVLEAACAQLAAWRAAGARDVAVAINMASPSFRKPHLAKQVAAQCDRFGLPPSALVLEVTESLLMQDMGAALQILCELRELGVRLAIDDFGTGYSSLSYLQRLPISQIKIDQSFVRDLVEDRDHAAITKAIISLGHALNLELVAEGVETSQQARKLMRMGCDIMQGFFFSRPLPAAQVTPMLVSRSSFVAQMHDTVLEDTLEFGTTLAEG